MTPNAPRQRDLLSGLAAIPSANFGGGMERLGLLDASIQSVWPQARVAGPAFYRFSSRSGSGESVEMPVPPEVIGQIVIPTCHDSTNQAASKH